MFIKNEIPLISFHIQETKVIEGKMKVKWRLRSQLILVSWEPINKLGTNSVKLEQKRKEMKKVDFYLENKD